MTRMELIRRVRHLKGTEIADLCGINFGTYYNLERIPGYHRKLKDRTREAVESFFLLGIEILMEQVSEGDTI